MSIPEDAPAWLVLAGLFLTTFGTVATGWFTARQGSTLKRVNEQVSNTHKTNLRDDLDEIHASIKCLAAKVDDINERTQVLESSGIRGFIKGLL